MRVALVSTFPPRRCGIADYTADFVRELALANDIDVHVLTYGDSIDHSIIPQDGLRVSRELTRRLSARRMAELLRKYEPDLVHLMSSSFLHHPSLNYALSRGCPVPLVTTVHDTPRSWRLFYAIPSLRSVYEKSSCLLTHSASVSQTLRCFHQLNDKRILEIPHGVDSRRYHPQADVGGSRKAFCLGDKKVVLFFGFLRPGKGIETLLEAWSIIAETQPGAVLVIAGGTPTASRRYAFHLKNEADYPGKLRRLANRLGITDTVTFTGYVPEGLVPGLIATAQAVVLPYDRAVAQSGPVHKTISSGKALITSEMAGPLGRLRDRGVALLVPPHDPGALSDSIIRLLTDQALCRELGSRARDLAERELEWSRVVQEIVRAYHAVIS